MTTVAVSDGKYRNEQVVPWIESAPRRPLCDVPWTGFSLVLSSGDVNFCCFSPAVPGNVNEDSFEEIWHGPMMKRIRRELSEQRLPAECCSTSCPIYRGDSLNFIVARMGVPDQEHAPEAGADRDLEQSSLQLTQKQLRIGDALDISIRLQSRGKSIAADLFIAIRQATGSFRFLPDYEDYAVPYHPGVVVRAGAGTAIDAKARVAAAGVYQISAALFAPGANPNVLANCYWSRVATAVVA